MNNKREKTYIYVSVFSSLGIILLWWLLSVILNASIILPTPVEVVKTVCKVIVSKNFLSNVGATILRALLSFIIIVISGTVCGVLAGRYKIFERIVSPLVALFKATPVMSIILLAFIWISTGAVPIFSAFLMAFPVMFVQTMDGYLHINPKLEQMCKIYGIENEKRIRFLVIPSLTPYIITGARQTLSMIWKVVIAAEVIILPKQGIGRALQLAQIQLETSTVFAWTIVAVILTAIGDYIFERILKTIARRKTDDN